MRGEVVSTLVLCCGTLNFLCWSYIIAMDQAQSHSKMNLNCLPMVSATQYIGSSPQTISKTLQAQSTWITIIMCIVLTTTSRMPSRNFSSTSLQWNSKCNHLNNHYYNMSSVSKAKQIQLKCSGGRQCILKSIICCSLWFHTHYKAAKCNLVRSCGVCHYIPLLIDFINDSGTGESFPLYGLYVEQKETDKTGIAQRFYNRIKCE